MWLQPGGHLDPGESPWDAARREASRRPGWRSTSSTWVPTGVPVLAHVDVHPGGRGHTHLDLRFVLGGDDRDPNPPDDESQDIAWFDWGAAIERAGDPRLAVALRSLRPTPGTAPA